MSSPAAPTRYAIGAYELDTQQKIVLRDGTRVALTPKAVDLLIVLATRTGEVVPKSDLMETVWPDAVVDESTLSKLVFNIRKELGDKIIETIPKRGYRLVGSRPLSVGSSTPPPPSVAPANSQRSTVNFIAIASAIVLLAAIGVFVMRRGTANNNLMVRPFTGPDVALAHNVSEFIISRLQTLSVSTGRSGAQLMLNAVVERNGDSVRLSYRVTSVDDAVQVAAATLTGSDLADLEGRAAEGIAAAVKLRQANDKALATPARQQTYLRAVALLSPDKAPPQIDEAIALLESLHADRSPLVLTAIGRAYLQKNARTHMQIVESYANKAAALDPNHPRVHALRGLTHRFRGEFPQAEREMRAALAVDPDAEDVLLDLARVYGALSRSRDAVKTYDYLQQVHPECAVCVCSYGVFELDSGRLEHAARLFQRAVALEPQVPGYLVDLAAVNIQQGRIEVAIPRLEQAVSIAPTSGALQALGYCQLLKGNADASARSLAEAVRLEAEGYEGWALYGDALRALHREQEADAAFDRSIVLAKAILAMDPVEPQVRGRLAECLAKRGKLDDAKRELATALQDPAPVPDLFASAAAVEIIAGDRNAAVESLRRAMDKGLSPTLLALDPRFAAVRTMIGNHDAVPMSSLPR